MSRELALSLLVVLTIMLNILTGSSLSMSLAVFTAVAMLFPADWYRRLCGYLVAVDLTVSAYLFSSFLGVAAVSAAQIGVFAALAVSVGLRLFRMFGGAERLELDGTTEVRQVFSKVFTQGVAWVKALGRSVLSGKPVEPPAPLVYTWVEVQPAQPLREVIGRMFGELRGLFSH